MSGVAWVCSGRSRTVGLLAQSWLLTGCLGANSAGTPAPALPRPERGYVYFNDRVAEVPWSIHIFKVERGHPHLGYYTTVGKDGALGMDTLSRQIKGLPPEVGQPLAAVNGDFYETGRRYYGRPRDLQISQGELISDPAGNSVFWLDPEGHPHATNLVSRFHVLWPNGQTTPFGLNEARPPDGAVLYTARVGPSTRTTDGTELVLEAIDECRWLPLQPGLAYMARIREVRPTGDTPVAGDTLVLSLGPALATSLPAAEEGTILQLATDIIPDLTGVQTALGGGPTLVRNGQVTKAGKGRVFQLRHPRAAVGWNQDYLFLVQVDGRQGSLSAGMTLPELADYMVRLGCDCALNLDGGGSATFWALGNVMNNPSEGHERPVANALVVVDSKPRDK